jgi:hypothetical protein
MNNAGGHMVILAGAGLSAVFLSVYMLAARQSEPASQETVVVTLPQRAPPVPQPAARPPSERPQLAVGSGPMSDPAALARTLQRELKRVGCYDGEPSGTWNAASRAAMKAFTERVNASLPVDRPDPVLLALVQAHQGRACGEACPVGEARGADGRCLPVAVIGKVQGKPVPASAAEPEPRMESSRAAPPPLPVPVPLPARKPPPTPVAAVEPPPPQVPKAAQPLDPPDPQATHPPRRSRHAGPVPAMRVYGRTIRRFVRRVPSEPAAVARSLLRNLERAAQGPW